MMEPHWTARMRGDVGHTAAEPRMNGVLEQGMCLSRGLEQVLKDREVQS